MYPVTYILIINKYYHSVRMCNLDQLNETILRLDSVISVAIGLQMIWIQIENRTNDLTGRLLKEDLENPALSSALQGTLTVSIRSMSQWFVC